MDTESFIRWAPCGRSCGATVRVSDDVYGAWLSGRFRPVCGLCRAYERIMGASQAAADAEVEERSPDESWAKAWEERDHEAQFR